MLTKSKIIKILKRKRRKFVKSMFARSSDWILLAEDSEIDLDMFKANIDWCNDNTIFHYHSEGTINIINDFNNMRSM